jgi:putative phosphoribosyl transferase
MGLFRDRIHAGQVLAKKLEHYRGARDLLVLALPRGGVPVGFEVAQALNATLDILLVRKLGLPGREELAMGAVATGGTKVLNDEVLQAVQVPEYLIERVMKSELRELERQEQIYKQGRATPAVKDRIVILVDDGLATGSTMRAAVQALRQKHPQWLVVAVPVGAAETCAAMLEEADEVICAVDPEQFISVGSWYEDFSPTSDATVKHLLQESAQW